MSATTAWIFRGSILVPTENPFVAEEPPCSNTNEEWLGPGLKLLLEHELHVNNVGIITHLAPLLPSTTSEASSAAVSAKIVQLSNTEFLCPGMIDLHIHAPQFIFTGTATDKPLMGK
jgi:cytosine/adenosine deaminase-related metal-dependent hydrolase